MLQAFSTPANRNRTFRLLALCVVLGLAAVIVGIGDNPLGIGLIYLAAIALLLAFVHPWQNPKQYLYLLCSSVLALAIFAVLPKVLFDMAGNHGHSILSGRLGVGAEGAYMFIILVLCPVLIIVGAIGALWRWVERL